MLCLALYGSPIERQVLNYINQSSIHLSYETVPSLASQSIASIIELL